MLWSKPVTITLLDGRRRTVVGPLDALKCLQNEWPVRGGAYYGCAIRACHAALRLRKEPDAARAAFIASAREAFLAIMLPTDEAEEHDPHAPR